MKVRLLQEALKEFNPDQEITIFISNTDPDRSPDAPKIPSIGWRHDNDECVLIFNSDLIQNKEVKHFNLCSNFCICKIGGN